MKRNAFALMILFALAPASRAQDMPLSQILIDGEGWKKASVLSPRRAVTLYAGTSGPNDSNPTGSVLSADKTTFHVGYADQGFLWAFQYRSGEKVGVGAPYSPLRTQRGEKTASVSALAADAAGRIYAATHVGIQVYDPTGRLCGVVALPATEKVDHLEVYDGHLRAWVGETQYTRKMSLNRVK